jgi:hypothetical protein
MYAINVKKLQHASKPLKTARKKEEDIHTDGGLLINRAAPPAPP